MQRTIRVFLGLSFLFFFCIFLTTTTYTLFLHSRGLDLLEVNLVNTIFHLSFFFLEIPTGVIADLYGRKVAYLASVILWSITAFVYAGAETFWGFAFAEFLAAVAGTCASGAFDAWAIDRLLRDGYTGSLENLMGQKNKLKALAMLLGGVLGGYLGGVDLTLPWLILGICMSMKVVLTYRFMQENWELGRKEIRLLEKIRTPLAASWIYIRHSQSFREAVQLDAAFVFCVQAFNMQWQPHFMGMLEKVEDLGYIKAGIAVSLFFGAWWLVRMNGSTPARRLIPLLLIGIGATSAMSALHIGLIGSVFFFLLHEFLRGMYYPAFMAYLNDGMPSEQRATINSIASMVRGLFGALGLLFSGFCGKYFGIPLTWVASGCFLIALGYFFRERKSTL